jgi:hypothetical protein
VNFPRVLKKNCGSAVLPELQGNIALNKSRKLGYQVLYISVFGQPDVVVGKRKRPFGYVVR